MHAANPNTNVFTSKRVDSNGDYQNETLEMDLGRPRKLSIKLLTSQLALENHCDELSSFFSEVFHIKTAMKLSVNCNESGKAAHKSSSNATITT